MWKYVKKFQKYPEQFRTTYLCIFDALYEKYLFTYDDNSY